MGKYYTPKEIADNLKVHLKTVYNWIKNGNLKAVKIGHFWRISESELNRLLNSGEQE